ARPRACASARRSRTARSPSAKTDCNPRTAAARRGSSRRKAGTRGSRKRASLSSLESAQEQRQGLVGAEHVAKLLDHVLEGGALLVVGERGGAVREHHHLVVEHHRVARGAFAADVGLG